MAERLSLKRNKELLDEIQENKADTDILGDLSKLKTSNKENIVSAINEIFSSNQNL